MNTLSVDHSGSSDNPTSRHRFESSQRRHQIGAKMLAQVAAFLYEHRRHRHGTEGGADASETVAGNAQKCQGIVLRGVETPLEPEGLNFGERMTRFARGAE